MQKVLEAIGGFGFMLAFAVLYFPGGTILMWLSCPDRRLDGLDWVLSVVIPGFGVARAVHCQL